MRWRTTGSPAATRSECCQGGGRSRSIPRAPCRSTARRAACTRSAQHHLKGTLARAWRVSRYPSWPAPQSVEEQRKDDEHADARDLDRGRQCQEVEPVAQHADRQNAKRGTEQPAIAALERCSTDGNG